MIRDMWTVITKDLREIIFNRGTARSGVLSILVVVGLIGIYLPLQTGQEWLTNPVFMLSWAWLPIFLVVSVVTDAIAGERERHTLETLLASRLTDRAILLGKIGAAVLYGWGMSMIGVLLGVVTINVAHSNGDILFFPAGIFFGMVFFSFLVALLMGSIGGVCLAARADRAGGLPAHEPGDAGVVPDADHPGAGAAGCQCGGRGGFSGKPEPARGGRDRRSCPGDR